MVTRTHLTYVYTYIARIVSEIKRAIRYTKVLQLCGITLLHTSMSNEILEYEPILKIPKALTEMRHLEVSGTPVLYIGRTVLKG
jgi:hypothetical protein